MKNKSLILTTFIMAFLFFLWWFSGGTFINVVKTTTPAEKVSYFLFNNFQVGLATVFDALSNNLNIDVSKFLKF